MTVGEDIRQRRKDKGWDQATLSYEARIPQSRISEIEGGTDPKASTLLRLYRALGVTLPWDKGRYVHSPLDFIAA